MVRQGVAFGWQFLQLLRTDPGKICCGAMKGRKRLSGLLPSWLKNRRIDELNHDEVG